MLLRATRLKLNELKRKQTRCNMIKMEEEQEEKEGRLEKIVTVQG